MAQGRIGKEKDGFLKLSKSDLHRIKGTNEQRAPKEAGHRKKGGKKGKKVKKGKGKGRR